VHPVRRRFLSLVLTAALAVTPAVPGRAATPEPVNFPRPGGGPVAIHALSDDSFGGHGYLLDAVTGEYRQVPYLTIRLSPDQRTVAVERVDGRIGVANRHALLRAGDRAVRWTELYSAVFWSPDGSALLHTTWDRSTGTRTALRYDVRTGHARRTPVPADCDVCTVGWAADSIRYTMMTRGADPAIPMGPVRYLNPDGSSGPLVGVDGLIWSAESYSPSRRYVIVEPARPFDDFAPADWQLPRIFDLRSGRAVAKIAGDWPVAGWYDERHVVRTAPAAKGEPNTLEVVAVRTGRVTKRIPAPGLPPCCVKLGSSAGLHGHSATFGF